MEFLFFIIGIVLGALISGMICIQKTEKKNLSLREQLSATQGSLQASQREIEVQQRLFAEQETIREQSNIDKLAIQKKEMETRLAESRQQLQQVQVQMKTEFENIANRIFEDKTQNFTKLNQDTLNLLLSPLKENLDSFRQKVETCYETEGKERHSLSEHLKELMSLNQQLSSDAQNLTSALRGDSKTQGNWGEMILETILEHSGLIKGEQYFAQEFITDEFGNKLVNTESGAKMQPDFVIRMPGDRSLIIDSKVSLTAFTNYMGATEETEREQALKAHLTSVKKHIDELSRKDYCKYMKQTPDFTMMFIPSEPAYLLALQTEPNLWNEAYAKKVVLITPTNLITALRLALDLWNREAQIQNVEKIVERGSLLYDKFASFSESLLKIGDGIQLAQQNYQVALNQFSEGKGNLVSQAEKLKELKIIPKKRIPAALKNEKDE
ncbi:MAG: DNA recombination protein RmuC [Bacteroidaceae bacterium]